MNKKFTPRYFLLVILLAMSCEKSLNSPIILPMIIASAVSGLEVTPAICGGNVMSNGGGTITAAGVIWSDAPIQLFLWTTKTIDRTSIGSFTSNITGLSPLSDVDCQHKVAISVT